MRMFCQPVKETFVSTGRTGGLALDKSEGGVRTKISCGGWPTFRAGGPHQQRSLGKSISEFKTRGVPHFSRPLRGSLP